MDKTFYTYDQQIAHLKAKGLSIPDEESAKQILSKTGYYPLICGYKHPFKNPTTKNYNGGVAFEDIVALYTFDEGLRNLFLRYLLLIEREIKSRVAYHFCARYGETQAAYLNIANYNNIPPNVMGIAKLVGILKKLATERTDYPYINHHQTNHNNVPLWVLTNALTFGNMSKMFGYLPQSLQSQICQNYIVTIPQMAKMLSVLTKYRNACAHGERLFSYETRDDIPDLLLHSKLNIPKKGTQYQQGKHDLFAVVISLRYLIPTNDFRVFKRALSNLIAKFTVECTALPENELLNNMGFPSTWKERTYYTKLT